VGELNDREKRQVLAGLRQLQSRVQLALEGQYVLAPEEKQLMEDLTLWHDGYKKGASSKPATNLR